MQFDIDIDIDTLSCFTRCSCSFRRGIVFFASTFHRLRYHPSYIVINATLSFCPCCHCRLKHGVVIFSGNLHGLGN
ncbi:hypothetical protein CY34DRAFT_813656 [Suillus luteus UH-Slu-Lm8-n1]|uniref:Uncharacterized protein n=1 Tax=Suillus luteus UH-Slu-Lm8-n1 TaxID=930992 RepID=A0A0D0AMV7_9AGAM|nr:hypothetical protein CY34DRAFT_813656 [Suillus luteus UH-Slu-Lm8-n1]